MSVCPAVDTVVGRVEAALREPNDVPVLEATGANGVEGSVPVEGLFGHLRRIREGYLAAASRRRSWDVPWPTTYHSRDRGSRHGTACEER